jgi:hypothetical protein
MSEVYGFTAKRFDTDSVTMISSNPIGYDAMWQLVESLQKDGWNVETFIRVDVVSLRMVESPSKQTPDEGNPWRIAAEEERAGYRR